MLGKIHPGEARVRIIQRAEVPEAEFLVVPSGSRRGIMVSEPRSGRPGVSGEQPFAIMWTLSPDGCVCACSAASDSCSPVDCSWPCSSIHGASQARILEQVVFLPDPGTEPTSPALAGGFVTTEPPAMSSLLQVLFFCCCSVSHLCLTLYDSMDCSMPGFPVFHYLPEFAQTHVF